MLSGITFASAFVMPTNIVCVCVFDDIKTDDVVYKSDED